MAIEAKNELPEDSTVQPVTKLDWALWFADKGFLILQLKPGSKNPLKGFGWLKARTNDPDTITQWFESDPDMNYGVCPGPNHVVIDLDIKPAKGKPGEPGYKQAVNGEAYLNELTTYPGNGDVPDTLTIVSPSGGKHKYFTTPRELGNAKDFDKDISPKDKAAGKTAGIDVRGAHGYVVGPGCELVRGQCKATDTPGTYLVEGDCRDIAPVPAWILDGYLRDRWERDRRANDPMMDWDLPENIAKGESFLRNRAPAIEGRGGNNWTFETVCFLRDFGISEHEAFRIIGASEWNKRCQPPWDTAELHDLIAHAYRYAQNRPGCKADYSGMHDRMNGLRIDPSAESTNESAANDDYIPGIDSGPEPQAGRKDRWADSAMTLSQASAKIGHAEMVIQGWVRSMGVHAFLAKRGTGKSVTMLDMAFCLAEDREWQGLLTDKGYYVFYLCGEDPEGTLDHANAWPIHHGLEHEPPRFRFFDMVPDLTSKTDCENCARYLRSLLPEGTKAAVFVDTWQRATAGAGQNKDDEMGPAFANLELIGRVVGGPTVAAFHPPKENMTTILGSSVIENGTVAILNMTDDAGLKTLKVARAKFRGEGNYRIMRFVGVGLGTRNNLGEEHTGAVAIPMGGNEIEDHQRAKHRAWAEAIAAEMQQATRDGTYGETKWSVNHVAERLSEKDYRVQGRACRFPKTGGSFRDELTKMFDNNPYDFADWRLELYRENKTSIIFRQGAAPNKFRQKNL